MVNFKRKGKMLYKNKIQEVIRRCLVADCVPDNKVSRSIEDCDSEISTLIHDVFGGEILKTYKNKRWHFYNRIDGERVDMAFPEAGKSGEKILFEDIPSSTTETSVYFDRYDYSTFYMKFVNTLEETIGLGQYKTGMST